MPTESFLVLIAFLVVCFAAAGIGSAFTAATVGNWYADLRKPAFTPPNWVFGPVWSALYLLMAVSAWLVWRNAGWGGAKGALLLFLAQLVLNVTWSALFFGLRRPGIALAEIFLLLAAIIATAVSFLPASRTAFWLMVPYAAWVCFASFLNFKIWQLNSEAK